MVPNGGDEPRHPFRADRLDRFIEAGVQRTDLRKFTTLDETAQVASQHERVKNVPQFARLGQRGRGVGSDVRKGQRSDAIVS